MKAKVILLTVVILLSTEGLVQAGPPGELGFTVDGTWSSRFIWRGFDWFYQNDSAFLVSGDVDFWGTGFGANITWVPATHSGHQNTELIIYHPYYGNAGWQGEPYQMNYRFGWRYYNAPDGPLRVGTCHPVNMDVDWQEAYGHFSWPNVCPAGVVPWYEFAVIWPDKGGRRGSYDRSYFRQKGGAFHTFGINKDWTVPGFLPKRPEQVIHTSFSMVYNDGAGPTPDYPRRNNADHDLSHGLFSVSTDIVLSESHSLLTFTPAIYYQTSWEDSVNTSDEVWFAMGLKYKF